MITKDSTILITGASDGIGRAISLRLAQMGCSLILLGRDGEKLKALQKEVNSANIFTYAFDLADKSALDANINKIIKAHSDITVLINNAGIWQKLSDIDIIPDETISSVINVNLLAPLLLTKHLIPVLKAQKEAAIVNISSKSGVSAQKGQTIYSASKWGLRGFTEVLKEDLKGTTVRVAGVYPGGVNTKMHSSFPNEQYTSPEDLAEVIAFMLTRPAKLWLNEIRINY